MYPFVLLAAAYFFFPKHANPPLKTKNSREKLKNIGAIMHLELRSPISGEKCILIFCVDFNGIDEIARGFTSRVDYRKSSNIMFKLIMLQKARRVS